MRAREIKRYWKCLLYSLEISCAFGVKVIMEKIPISRSMRGGYDRWGTQGAWVALYKGYKRTLGV